MLDWLTVRNTLAYCGTEYISAVKYIVIQPPGAESTTTFIAVCILIVQSVATASGLRCPSTDLYYKHITIVNDDSKVVILTLQIVASPLRSCVIKGILCSKIILYEH